jgi:hypothetical protein
MGYEAIPPKKDKTAGPKKKKRLGKNILGWDDAAWKSRRELKSVPQEKAQGGFNNPESKRGQRSPIGSKMSPTGKDAAFRKKYTYKPAERISHLLSKMSGKFGSVDHRPMQFSHSAKNKD